MTEEVLTHKPTRSATKYVNEAFSFLNLEDVDDTITNNEVVQQNPLYISKDLHTAKEDNFAETNGSIDTVKKENEGVKTETVKELDSRVKNETQEEFRIITSVEDSTEVIVNGENTTKILNHVDSSKGNGDEFSIVTFVEDDRGLKRGLQGETFGKIGRGLIEINPVYEVTDYIDEVIKDSNEVIQDTGDGKTVSEDAASDNNESQVETGPDDSSVTAVESNGNERLSVVIDNEVVELRTHSPNEIISRQSRQPTWRKNQHFVSEAFDFLKEIDTDDIDAVRDSVLINGFNVKSCSECGQTLTPNEKVTVDDKGQSLCKHCDTKHTESGEVNGGIAETDEIGDLPDSKPGLMRKRRLVQQSNTGDDDGNSSDEDKGVYRESFRKSTWLYIGDNEEIKESRNQANYISLSNLGVDTCDTDSVFGDNVSPLSPLPDFSQMRNDSIATTLSEQEFRSQYNSVSRRFVKRADSQQEYKRFTTRGYDNLKSITIERDSSVEFGIHILDSRPAVISGIDAGSAAESSGLKEGQIVVSVNGVNVLEANHDEIISLVHRDSKTLTIEVGGGDPTVTLDLQVPVMTGYLQKQVSSTIFRTWKRRYFILRRDNCLYYYKNEKETDPLGAIPLNCYTVSRHGDLNKFGFKAEKYNSKTFYFMAENREQMTNWVGALNDAAQKGKSKDSWMDVTAHNVGLPALNIRNPDCSGYLFKMGRATRRWRKRYCVLKDACIYYYRNANSKEADGVAHLHGYTVEVSGVSGKKFSFSLRPPETQMRTFSFYTDNDTDKLRWVQSLNTSIKKWVKVD
ncbi:uncharacterized protein LOC123540709 [Mercenaria mercenaria]|uniref:uncharacterized protein LOC123540709 n=1 Tax=Mercenaria mercenaria TaxID=6596 RepID=UPI00234F3B0C|nr:uncharacterized protein LOC123540709 [Mercenaria mercenaria]XP_045181883.2 uncharacterized protein LOC123540709 [Mercenaria mercenaria]XP_045181884.2 uncharacterized protein LOC123540709 [Mercenaria mercenaria]XP_045181885.2 uncharacterized protein LOC123540709 [Mercenaria mercenaria]